MVNSLPMSGSTVYSVGAKISGFNGVMPMKAIKVELPEKLAQELEAFVKEGWFRDEVAAIRYALAQFLNRYRLQLTEHFQREDIAWALKWKEAKK
ncbi:MAG: hypothetical protein LKKZDAJK_000149 [Candidatus Fervidibacter sp.]